MQRCVETLLSGYLGEALRVEGVFDLKHIELDRSVPVLY